MGGVATHVASMKLSLKQMWVYKFDFIMWAVSAPLVFAVYYFLWRAVYSYSGQTVIRGFTFPQMISYYILVIVMGTITFNWVDRALARKVKFGDLTRDLVRPYNFFSFEFSRNLGERLLALLIEVVPLLTIGVLFFGLVPGSSVAAWLFVASIILAFLLSYTLTFLIALSSFWLKEYRGVHTLRHGLFILLSGGMIPLSFFPDAAQQVFKYLPFQYLRYIPILIFNGQLNVSESITSLAISLVWVVGTLVLCIVVWKRAIKEYTGVGA